MVNKVEYIFGSRAFRIAAPTVWNSLPPHVRSCTTLTTFRKHFKITSVSILLSHCLVTHPSASDSFATLALYKFTYLLTYILT